jgi:hypothetical protein
VRRGWWELTGKAADGEAGGGGDGCNVPTMGAAPVVAVKIQQSLWCQSEERGVRDDPIEEDNGGVAELT